MLAYIPYMDPMGMIWVCLKVGELPFITSKVHDDSADVQISSDFFRLYNLIPLIFKKTFETMV